MRGFTIVQLIIMHGYHGNEQILENLLWRLHLSSERIFYWFNEGRKAHLKGVVCRCSQCGTPL